MTVDQSDSTACNAGEPHDETLIQALRILAILPNRLGVSRDWIMAELTMSKAQFYRIMRIIAQSGIVVETGSLPDGRKGFFLGRQQQWIVDRILRVKD